MVDVVLDLKLEEWLERERAEAVASAVRRMATAQQHVGLVRHMYAGGDEAHARGDDELADRLWTAARCLHVGTAGELVDGELVT